MGTTTQVKSDGTAVRLTISDNLLGLGTASEKDIPASGDATTGQVVYGTDTRLTNARTALAHTHAAGDVTGTAVLTADARLSDARTPTSHAASHKSAGGDAIILDELKVPTVDVTTLDATTSVHGLLPKLGGGTANFLRADGTWAAPPGGSPAFVDPLAWS